MTAEAVARALAYPFAPPDDSFVFEDGAARPFSPGADLALVGGRRPVLATGSNASPARLAEKMGPGERLAVTRALVRGHVVAHSAKIADYGSIPATLHPWPGVDARVHVTWLDERQLEVMDATETLGVAYDRIRIETEFVDVVAEVGAEVYISRAGALGFEGRPAVTRAARLDYAGAAPRAFGQRQAQARAIAILGLELTPERFIAENLADAALRARRSAELTRLAGLPYARARA